MNPTWWICAAGIAFSGSGPWYAFDEAWKPNRARIRVIDGNAHAYLHKQTFISWSWGEGPAVIAPPRGARMWIQTSDPTGEFDARSWTFTLDPLDVNTDGRVNSADSLTLLGWVATNDRRGDWNADGATDSNDIDAYTAAARSR